MNTNRFDMVFASLENWDEVWRRNQFFVADMAQRNPSGKFLFLGLPRNVTGWLAGRSPRPSGPAIKPLHSHPNVLLVNSLKWFPNATTWGQSLNDRALLALMRRAVHKYGLQRPVLWINAHYCLPLVGQLGESLLVYDITDDWTAFAQPPRELQRTIEQDAELCRRADAVITCSTRLQELKTPLSRRPPTLIPNGVDVDHYVSGMQKPVPADLSVLRRPTVGYVGTVHPQRVDMPLVMEVARTLPHVSFVFIGPMLLSDTDVQAATACSNITFLGPRPYSTLPAYMGGLDVCMTPHLVTDFTESLNPIKLWEYLATGKPLVSTNVAGFRDYPQFVRLASSASDFAAAIGAALADTRHDPSLARAEAARNSWSQRVDVVMSLLTRKVSHA